MRGVCVASLPIWQLSMFRSLEEVRTWPATLFLVPNPPNTWLLTCSATRTVAVVVVAVAVAAVRQDRDIRNCSIDHGVRLRAETAVELSLDRVEAVEVRDDLHTGESGAHGGADESVDVDDGDDGGCLAHNDSGDDHGFGCT